MARELQVPILATAAVNRGSLGEMSQLSDLRDSGSLEAHADLVLFLNPLREPEGDDYQLMQVHLAKQTSRPRHQLTLTFHAPLRPYCDDKPASLNDDEEAGIADR